MFDGAAVTDAAHVAADAAAKALIPAVPAAVQVRAADPSRDGGKKEVVFVDTSVAGYQGLVNSVRAGAEVELIGGGNNGLAQIAQWAESHSGYDSISILSHGAEGQVTLGTAALNDTLLADATVQAELAEIGHSLKAGGDLLVYGCDVAKGTDGQTFIHDLAAATGAGVAASTNLTGNAALGGDWVLEYQTGNLNVMSVIADPSYFQGVLATAQLDFSSAFNANVVLTTANHDATTIRVDSGAVYATDTYIKTLLPTATGLSNNASYAANASHPDVVLGWSDSASANNAWKLSQGETGSKSFVLSAGDRQNYASLQVYAIAAGVDAWTPDKFTVTLHYTDGTATVSSEINGLDWWNSGSTPTTGTFALGSDVYRVNNADLSLSDTAKFTIWGYSIAVNSSKTLQSMDITVTQNAAGNFVFFGATATTDTVSTMNVTATPPNTAPTYISAGAQSLSLAHDAAATDIKSYLHVSDGDASQTETWSQSSAPSHGSLSFSGATATSGSTDITPGGSITYTPASGYSGTDSFTIRVSDGTATAIKTFNVTVAPAPEVYKPVSSQTVNSSKPPTVTEIPTQKIVGGFDAAASGTPIITALRGDGGAKAAGMQTVVRESRSDTGGDGTVLPTNSTVAIVAMRPSESIVVANPIGEVIQTGQVSFIVPSDAFATARTGEAVRLQATQADGRPLPAWLVFNPTSGRFEGSPPTGQTGVVEVRVSARDGSGAEASQVFRIVVRVRQGADAGGTSRHAFVGKTGLAEQIRAAKGGPARFAALIKAIRAA